MGEVTTIPKRRADNQALLPRFPDRTLIIMQMDDGLFDVIEGERRVTHLGWDEMLGHIAATTIAPGFRGFKGLTPNEEAQRLMSLGGA